MAQVTRMYFPVRCDVEEPHPLFIGEMSERQLEGGLYYVNTLRDNGTRVEYFTLPDGTDIIAVYAPNGDIWETWAINS